MNIYKIDEEIENLIATCIDEETGEILSDVFCEKIEELEDKHNKKIDNIVLYIKNQTAFVKAIKEEEEKLYKKRKSVEKRAEFLKNHTLQYMKFKDIKKLQTPNFAISLRKNPESLIIENEPEFIENLKTNNQDKFLDYSIKIKKVEIKKAMQAGEKFGFAKLESSERLVIK